MRLRVSVDVWCGAFATALGLLPGCGGNAVAPNGNAAGGSASGGTGRTELGGRGHSGGSNSGGAVSSGSAVGAGSAVSSGGAVGAGGGTTLLGGSAGITQGGSAGIAQGGSAGVAQGGSAGIAQGGSADRRGEASCPNPKPVLIDGQDSGFVTCDNELKHRTHANTCPSSLVPGHVCDGRPETSECTSDSQCTLSPHGFCAMDSVLNCRCSYGCLADSDCAEGQICECGNPVGQCVNSSCKDDAACGEGSFCASYNYCGRRGFACQTLADACVTGQDCPGGFNEVCGLNAQNTRECQLRIQACVTAGRPFLVAGAERLATLGARAGWQSSPFTPDCTPLSVEARASLAEAWARNALMEHASIAAFARFALQLMALGAPASLLEETHAAMADETRHAQHCFALASSFAGTRLGPERLAVDRALEDITPKQVLITTILEGCIGETVAAVEAAEALQFATDEAVRSVLQQITIDEEKHAALAWNTVRFLLVEHPELVPVAQQVFSEACSGERSEGAGLQEKESEKELTLLCYGVVGAARRAEIRAQVLAGIVAPCARALLGGASLVTESHHLHLC